MAAPAAHSRTSVDIGDKRAVVGDAPTALPRDPVRLARVISGGQTGVDRAALDAASAAGIAHGGWCPRGRRAEDGVVPARYALREHRSVGYAARTEANVRASDGTLIVARGPFGGGTALTRALARRHRRPCLVVDLADEPDPVAVRRWIARQAIAVLNVAGPRESQRPGIGAEARRFLGRIFGAETPRACRRRPESSS